MPKSILSTTSRETIESISLLAYVAEAAEWDNRSHLRRVKAYAFTLFTGLGLKTTEAELLALACVLHDVGKAATPDELLKRQGSYTTAEWQMMERHTIDGEKMLRDASSPILRAGAIIAHTHHERWDGSGYPRGLKLKEIGRGAEMAGLVDSFCAMLKNKPYRAAMGHQNALEQLFNLRDQQFNPALMEQFVQCVGLYPIGTLVEMNNGEVGVVIQQNRIQRSRPRVLLLLDGMKQKMRGYHVIDLRDPRHKAYTVLRTLPQDAYGLAAQDYYLG
jgi:putative nucleotidyltransferase with HDIG domain